MKTTTKKAKVTEVVTVKPTLKLVQATDTKFYNYNDAKANLARYRKAAEAGVVPYVLYMLKDGAVRFYAQVGKAGELIGTLEDLALLAQLAQ